ncbi:MAG: alpha/beta hydrolase [Clostridia bacterium]
MDKIKKPIYKKVWFYVVAILLLFVIIFGIVLSTSYAIAEIVMDIVCNDKNPSTPENYSEILLLTDKIANVEYSSKFGENILDIISPKNNSQKLPLIVYIHGGYYTSGDKLTKEAYCRVIAQKGYVVANINYLLSPEAVYPTQLIQVNDAIKFLLDNATKYNIDSDKIFIGGDSAGGHLSGQLGCLYTNEAFANKLSLTPVIKPDQLKGVLLLCGFFNFYTVRDTNFPLLNQAMWMFTGVKEYENSPYAGLIDTISNVNADYPDTYIICGDYDPFYKQNQEMSAKLKSLGVKVVDYLPTTTSDKLQHEFQSNFDLKECYEGLDKLFDFLASASKD